MKSSKSSLFLIELIISILFFSLASAACIQLFVKAHLLDKKTRETNQIVMWSQNLSELWYAADGELLPVYEQLTKDYETQASSILLKDNASRLCLYFDKAWNLCDAGNSTSIVYTVELRSNDRSDVSYLNTAELTFYKTDGENSDTSPLHIRSLAQHTVLERGNIYE